MSVFVNFQKFSQLCPSTGRIDLQDVSARACFFSLILSLRNSASFRAIAILSAMLVLIVDCASVGLFL